MEVSVKKIPKAVFIKEFKEEAVKMVTEDGLSIPELSRRLSIPKSTLVLWIKKANAGKLSSNTHKIQKQVAQEEMELARLRREPVMCGVLSVSKIGYYTWLKRPLSKRVIENNRLQWK